MSKAPTSYQDPQAFDPSRRMSLRDLARAGKGRPVSRFALGAAAFCFCATAFCLWLAWDAASGDAGMGAEDGIASFEALRRLFAAVVFAGAFLCFAVQAILIRRPAAAPIGSRTPMAMRKPD